MTCILGWINKEDKKTTIKIAADSLVSSYRKFSESTNNKILEVNKHLLLACTGHVRFGDLIEYQFIPPSQCFSLETTDKEIDEYVGKMLVPSLVSFCEREKLLEEKSNRMTGNCYGSIMIAAYDQLYIMFHDFSLIKIDRFSAIGSGEYYALAAFSAITNYKTDYKNDIDNIMKLSVKTASQFCKSCDDRVTIKTLEFMR